MSSCTYQMHWQNHNTSQRNGFLFTYLQAFILICSCLMPTYSYADLRLTGQAVQGGLIIGQTKPGALVTLDGAPLGLTKDGLFLVGFHRDDTDDQIVHITMPDGAASAHILTPKPRKWEVQRINGLAQKYVSPPDDVIARISADREAVSIARRGTDIESSLFENGFSWPVSGPVTGVYGSQRILNGKPRQPHYGIDIAAPKGTIVKTSAPGRVTMAKDLYYTGWTVIIDHGFGLTSTYSHLDKAEVSVGDTVSVSQVIGRVGSTGRSTGAHLDWRVNLGAKRLDPQIVARVLNPDSR